LYLDLVILKKRLKGRAVYGKIKPFNTKHTKVKMTKKIDKEKINQNIITYISKKNKKSFRYICTNVLNRCDTMSESRKPMWQPEEFDAIRERIVNNVLKTRNPIELEELLRSEANRVVSTFKL